MGEKLVELRKRQRLSQRMLSAISGVSRPTIASIESGRALSVRTSTLTALAKALGVSVSYFFD